MKVSYGTLSSSLVALSRLAAKSFAEPKINLTMARALRSARDHLKDYAEAEPKMLARHAEKHPNGQPVFLRRVKNAQGEDEEVEVPEGGDPTNTYKILRANAAALAEDRKKLEAEVVDLPVEPVKLADVSKPVEGAPPSGAMLEALAWLIADVFPDDEGGEKLTPADWKHGDGDEV